MTDQEIKEAIQGLDFECKQDMLVEFYHAYLISFDTYKRFLNEGVLR